ncbi:MAG: hypothetical protein IJK58_00045 [Clostridia bacterium]|nr:hypothetical protein [Clostridia bacterium]
MYEFRVKLAGVPALIRCRFEQNRTFFRDFLSEEDPRFCVQPTDADFERIISDFKRARSTDLGLFLPKTEVKVENLAIHSLLAEKLVAENVLLMHGSAVRSDGEAIVFTAKSGTGKSTHTRLWRETFGDRVVMINDDKPLLRIEEDRVTVCGSPWRGKHRLGSNISAPLKAIVKLERAPVNRIGPMERADAFQLLTGHAFMSNDPPTAMRIIGMEKRLLDMTDFYVLGCNTDPEAARVARDGIFGPDEDITDIKNQ